MMKNSQDYLNMIGNRIKLYRINSNLSQQELADQSGVSVRTISRLEQGASVQLEGLICILDALNVAGNFELLIPDQTRDPFYYVKNKEKQRQRVGRKNDFDKKFKWGDDI